MNVVLRQLYLHYFNKALWGDRCLPLFCLLSLSSECPFHDISPCRVRLTMPLWVFIPLHLSPHSWFICRSLWLTFSVVYHLTLSSLRGSYYIIRMLPWFDGFLVWAMYSVVDPIYKAIVVAGYLCISVRWIIYHIDTLSLCLHGGSSDHQFLSDDRFVASSCFSDALHDHLFCSYFRGHSPVGGFFSSSLG